MQDAKQNWGAPSWTQPASSPVPGCSLVQGQGSYCAGVTTRKYLAAGPRGSVHGTLCCHCMYSAALTYEPEMLKIQPKSDECPVVSVLYKTKFHAKKIPKL